MSEYRAQVWLAGEPTSAVEAVIALYGGRVLMHTRGEAIGDWDRREVFAEVMGDKIKLSVEGEKLILAPIDQGLAEALVGQPDLAAKIRELAQTARPLKAKHLARRRGRWAVASSVAVGVLVVGSLGRSSTIDPTTTEPATTATVGGIVETTSTIAPTTTTVVGPVEVVADLVSVTDGDTIRVLLPSGVEEPVRLIGIDAPELGQRLAEESTVHLGLLLGSGPMRLVPDVSNRDRFDRLLRYVYAGDVFINQEMVRAGMAVARRYPPDTSMATILEEAQIEARSAGMGGWATATTSSSSTTTTAVTTTATAAPTTTAAENCHPSYEGACLAVDQGDYDCAGGNGNGPNYVQGPVYVVGPDSFDLDRDGDGVGCES